MKLRKIIRNTAIGGLALAAVGIPAAGAIASDASTKGTHLYIRGELGGVRFNDYGEKFTVSDYLEDGIGIKGYIQWGSSYQHKDSRRVGGSDDVDQVNYAIKEGTKVRIKMCYTIGSPYKCSKWKYGTA